MASNLDALNDAFKIGDYASLHFHLEQLKQTEPNNPWIPYFEVLLEEEKGQKDQVYYKYQQLLKEVSNPKILSKIRQRLLVIETEKKQSHQNALSEARNTNQEAGILIIEPVDIKDKTQLAQNFAQIMKIDPYTAYRQLPTRSWRLSRTGNLGELQFYTQQLLQAEIPAFAVGIKSINSLNVYYVNYIESIDNNQITLQYALEQNKTASYSCKWSEVKHITRGMVPFFSELVEVKWEALQAKIEKKSRTTDYIKLCDLHIKEQNLILRFRENTYQYSSGALKGGSLFPALGSCL